MKLCRIIWKVWFHNTKFAELRCICLTLDCSEKNFVEQGTVSQDPKNIKSKVDTGANHSSVAEVTTVILVHSTL